VRLVYTNGVGLIVAHNAGAAFSLKYHLVWCPKYRRAVLTGSVAERLKALLSEKAAHVNAILHVMQIMPDHVHLFVETPPTCAPASLAGLLKGYPSRALRCEVRHLRDRLPALWSRSSDIGTIGHVSEPTVRRYIAAQRGR